MKTAKQFLKNKKLKDTLYNVEADDGSWVKGGLSKLLDEYADSKVKNFSLPTFANLCRECGKTIAKPREYCDEHYPYKIVSKRLLTVAPDDHCICTGDQYGGATNPKCLIHGK